MKMQAKTVPLVIFISSVVIALTPASLMAGGFASPAVEDATVAQYAPGEAMWCPEMNAEVPAELHQQMNCTEVATGFAQDAVAGVRITNTSSGGLLELVRSVLPALKPHQPGGRDVSEGGDSRIVTTSAGQRPIVASAGATTAAIKTAEVASAGAATRTEDRPDRKSPDPTANSSRPSSEPAEPIASKGREPKTEDRQERKPPETGKDRSRPTSEPKQPRKGDNGWGNGPDTTNAGSFSGGTASSKSTNGRTRNDKNYPSALDKFEGR